MGAPNRLATSLRRQIRRKDLLARCNSASCAPSRSDGCRRQRIAADILAVLSGRSLSNTTREKELRAAMIPLRLLPKPPPAWQMLSDSVASNLPSSKLDGCGSHRSGARTARQMVKRNLDWRRWSVPDIEGAKECHCQLTSSSLCQRFRQPAINSFLAALFEALPAAFLAASLSPPGLNRFDLFHGHVFAVDGESADGCLNDRQTTGGLGILFHAREYPAQNNDTWRHNLGFCQHGSPMKFDARKMDLRNIVYFRRRAAVLDVGPRHSLGEMLIMDGLQEPRTVQEQDFGDKVLDINYFASLTHKSPSQRVFVCL